MADHASELQNTAACNTTPKAAQLPIDEPTKMVYNEGSKSFDESIQSAADEHSNDALERSGQDGVTEDGDIGNEDLPEEISEFTSQIDTIKEVIEYLESIRGSLYSRSRLEWDLVDAAAEYAWNQAGIQNAAAEWYRHEYDTMFLEGESPEDYLQRSGAIHDMSNVIRAAATEMLHQFGDFLARQGEDDLVDRLGSLGRLNF